MHMMYINDEGCPKTEFVPVRYTLLPAEQADRALELYRQEYSWAEICRILEQESG